MEPGGHEPRVQSLHALMREIGDLRRRLESDLTLTAAALEHSELAVADDLLADGISHVEAFDQVARLHLDRPALAPRQPRPVRRVPARPVPAARPPLSSHLPRAPRTRELAAAAAAAVLAVVVLATPASQGGVVVQASAPPPDLTTEVVSPEMSSVAVDLAASYEALSTLARMTRPAPVEDIRAVADELAQQVTMLSTTPEPDPKDSIAALRALQAERRVITANDPERTALVDLMERNQRLTASLLGTLTVLMGPALPLLAGPGAVPPTDPATVGDLLGSLASDLTSGLGGRPAGVTARSGVPAGGLVVGP